MIDPIEKLLFGAETIFAFPCVWEHIEADFSHIFFQVIHLEAEVAKSNAAYICVIQKLQELKAGVLIWDMIRYPFKVATLCLKVLSIREIIVLRYFSYKVRAFKETDNIFWLRPIRMIENVMRDPHFAVVFICMNIPSERL